MCSLQDGNDAPSKRTTLHDLYEKQGQSPWYDNLCRPVTDLLPLIASGVRGVTSNPTVIILECSVSPFYKLHFQSCFWAYLNLSPLQIFQKAISSSNAYDEQFRYSADLAWPTVTALTTTIYYVKLLVILETCQQPIA